MKDVYLIGIGQTPVVRGPNNRVHALAASAVKQAIDNANIDPVDIGALYVGNMASGILSSQTQLGALVAENAGLSPIEALTVEAACASGGAAARMGFLAVASGAHRAVVVCGAEQLSHAPKHNATRALATAADYDTESSHDETFISLNAMLQQRYFDRYRIKADALSGFSIAAHSNAVNNPNALFRKHITIDEYCASRIVVPPLHLFDISPICDGAAAIVLANEEVVKSLLASNTHRVRVIASSVATTSVSVDRRNDPLDLTAVRHANELAFAQTGMQHKHIDVLELHDAYTIMTTLCLEAGGFAKPGAGWARANDGSTALSGDLPIATMGGLKARGHPVGATGVYQMVEAFLQLTGQAGQNQITGAEIAMTQSVGGTGTTVVDHILQRID